MPTWFNPYAVLELSEFDGWEGVRDWALILYNAAITNSPPIQQSAATIRREHESPEQRLLAALEFVQDQIRYLGLEIGPNSHQSHEV